MRGPPRRRQESPWGASLAQGPEASGKPGGPREEPAGGGGRGAGGRNVRDERERQARKDGGCQSPGSPTLSLPGCPGGQASLPASTHLTDTGWVPPSMSLPLIGTEIQRAAISRAQCCPALTPKWEGWGHRPFGEHSCAHHASSCTSFSKPIKLATAWFLCLRCCALSHLPGDLVVLLVPDRGTRLRCPLQLPWAGEVSCPSSAWPSTALSTDLQDHLAILYHPYPLAEGPLWPSWELHGDWDHVCHLYIPAQYAWYMVGNQQISPE